MDQKRIGAFIAALRRERGLTQKELAQKLMVSDKTVSKWECGRGLPEVSLMQSLCAELGIGINELLAAERLEGERYRENAERHVSELLRRRTRMKQATSVAVSMLMFLLPFVAIVLTAGKLLPPACMLVSACFSLLLLVANAAGWIVYGVVQKWNRLFLICMVLWHIALLVALLWLLNVMALGFMML